MFKSVGHWLVQNGLFRDLLGILLAYIWARLMRIGRTLRQIADRLDTKTPGGLGDLVDSDDDNEVKFHHTPKVFHRK